MRMRTRRELDAKNTAPKMQYAGVVVPVGKDLDVNGMQFHHADQLYLGKDWS